MKKTLTLILALSLNFVNGAIAQEQNEQEIVANAAAKFFGLSSQEKWAEAKPFAQQAYELGQTIYSESDPLFGTIAYQLGTVQVALKEPSALVPLTQAKINYEQNQGADSASLIPVLSELASAHILSNNSEEAETHINRALEIASKEYGSNSTLIADLSGRTGKEFKTIGNYKLALELQKQAYSIYLGVFGPSSAKTGEAAYEVSESSRLDGNITAQASFLRKTVDTFSTPLKATSEFERTVHTKFAQAYHALGKPKRATKNVLALAYSNPSDEPQAPVLLVKSNANYQGRVDNENLDGFVSLKYDVDANGFVKNAELLEADVDRKLINLAIKTLNNYRYIPATSNGKTVETSGLETKITFKPEA